MTKDLTKGRPLKVIAEISVPIFISFIVQQLYNMVDTIVVGQMIGSDALAAVGATGNLYNFFLSMVMGLTQGFAVIMANQFGAGDESAVRKTLFNSLVLVGAVSAVITGGCLIFLKDFLLLMHTPERIFEAAYGYLFIIIAGMAVTTLLNLVYAALRALGDTKTPLRFLLLSSILNIFLDIGFVLFMKNGVKAVAYATVISQMFALVMCVGYIYRHIDCFRLRRQDCTADGVCIRQLLGIGLPMAAQGAITQVGFLVLQSSINTFGVEVVAGYTAGNKLEQFCLQPLNTFGAAMAGFVGQNYGAKKIGRIRQGVRECTILCVGVAIVLGICLRLFGGGLIGLFVDKSNMEVIGYGLQYVNTFSVFLSGVGMIFLYRNILQGMGNAVIPMFVGILELTARLAWVMLLKRQGTYATLCLVNPITWVIAAIPLIVGYVWLMRRYRRKYAKEA